MKQDQPRFRPDIVQHLYDEKQGGYSIVLEDPVANRFFRISPYEFELLKVMDGSLSVSEAIEKLRLRGRHFTVEHASKLMDRFSMAGLLLGTQYGTSKVQDALKSNLDRQVKSRTLFKIFYLYLPLVNPDKFLQKTLWLWRIIVNRFTAAVIAALVPGALYLLINRLPGLQEEFSYFFNIENLLVLWIAIAGVKLVHELSHAYTSKRLGLRVPEMGIALLIFFPCLYCNTTAAWQLADRKQRMSIALAGVLAELAVAVISVYVWSFTKPGLLNSIAFFLMAVSVVSSFLFNGNPLLKFDGYFVLMDYLRIPNLQTKAFGYVRYLLLNKVFGIETVTGTTGSMRERIIFAVYGPAALLYRILVVTSIVVGVYYRFDKTVGVIMGSLAFTLFIVRPVGMAAVNMAKRRSELHFRPRGLAVFLCLTVIAIFLLTRPWANNSVYPCYLESEMVREIVVPADAPVLEVPVRQGDDVEEGRTILKLDPVPLEFNLRDKEAQKAFIQKEISVIENSQKDLAKIRVKRIELAQAEDAIRHIENDLRNVEWKAPFSGAVIRLSPTLQPGAGPGKGAVVGEMAAPDRCEVLGLVPEEDVGEIPVGAKVRVWFPVEDGKTFELTVRETSPFKTEDLEGSPFSSRFGGEIATEAKEETGKDTPLDPHYIVKMSFPKDGGVPLGMTGRLVVEHPPRSALRRVYDAVNRTLHREVIF